jgi:hypothetical protein
MQVDDGSSITAAPSRGWRVVVDSIGKADAGLVPALAKALPLTEARLAELLYRAPSVLLDDVPQPLAERVTALLRDAGIAVRCSSVDEPLELGEGQFEVALVIREVARLPEVIAMITRTVGLPLAQAVEVVCASPAVLIGNVSAATVAALQDRFAPLDVEIDVSNVALARFDVFTSGADLAHKGRIARILAGLNLPPELTEVGRSEDSPMVAVGLAAAQASELWERLRGNVGPLRVLNRDFARFDLRLLDVSAADDQALAEFLVTDTGMPRRLAADIGRHLPLILHEDLSAAATEACLAALTRLGARAEASLTCFQSFDLELSEIGDRKATFELLASLGRVDERGREQLAARLPPWISTSERVRLPRPVMIPGPFTKVRARWLVHECAKIGTVMELSPR